MSISTPKRIASFIPCMRNVMNPVATPADQDGQAPDKHLMKEGLGKRDTL
jgi:hypothetical protein